MAFERKLVLLVVAGPWTAALAGRKKTINLREKAVRQITLVNEGVGAVATTLVGKRKTIEFGKDNHARVRTGEADLFGSLQSVHPRHAEI